MFRTKAGVGAALILFLAASPSAQARDGFLFDGDGVSMGGDVRQRIRIGERLTRAELGRRFPGFSVEPIESDCGGTCFNIANAAGSLQISYGGAGRDRFYLLTSDAPTTRDVSGNRVGTSLRSAIGAASAQCDDGMTTSCRSARIRGLSYDVEDKAGCILPRGSRVTIPACAIVGGFRILR